MCTLLQGISAADKKTVPLNLEKLRSTEFSRYLATFKKTVQSKKKGKTQLEEVEIHYSVSSFDATCLALSSLCLDSGLDKMVNEGTAELWTKLSMFKKGARRRYANEKQEHGLKNSEGKRPIFFNAYRGSRKNSFCK